ncbi:MAG: phospholipase D-like domain-containing protein [Bacteriovoracaceae bacterium]
MKTTSKTLCLSFLFIACSNEQVFQLRSPAGDKEEVLEEAAVRALPQLSKESKRNEFESIIQKALAKNQELDESQKDLIAENIASYLGFLKADISPAKQTDIVNRLLNSSTQFAVCPSFDDWACLEKIPLLKPKTLWRQETESSLGQVIKMKKPLQLEFWFTEQWDKPTPDFSNVLANVLAKKIKEDSTKSLYLALYGIDDHEKSMKPVFDAISNQVKNKVDVKAVFDTESVNKSPNGEKQIFSYFKPAKGNWIFDPAPVQDPKKTVPQTYTNYTYDATPLLMANINAGVKQDKDTLGRLEWPTPDIMHNKFFILKSETGVAVWTGSTNVAKTCMGIERNSNVAVYIKNPEIVATFEKEFFEMYGFFNGAQDKRYIAADLSNKLLLGAFHGNKRPNTPRYFMDSEGTEIKVHFSPTDDGEHRMILPMLLSAREGDIIRIAAFSGGGYESTRAIQYAAAKGAEVRIILDGFNGIGPGSWFKDVSATVNDPNPFENLVKRNGKMGKIILLKSNWKGLNHHKSGSLSRKISEGKYRHEMVIVGSQNWTGSGNDSNDENMIGIRNLTKSVPLAESFANHFDNRLWATALKGKLTPTK